METNMLLAPIVEIFCDIDDFYKSHAQQFAAKALPLVKGKRCRKTDMSESEMMTLMILFHVSHYRTFKDFYIDCVLGSLTDCFPKAVSYPRFVALMPRLLEPLTAYVLSKTGKQTHLYYIDSTKMVVCHNRRISRNKVFKGIAERGHSSVGYFFGFKVHLAINHQGELMSFCITKGNVDDRKVVTQLLHGLTGLGAGDKGYIDKKLMEALAQQDLRFITKVRKNMKKRMLSSFEKFFLAQRSIIETVIDQLKSICHIEHTRHRSPMNFLINLVSGLAGYCLKPRKPSIKIDKLPSAYALIHN
jgi:IS5 family transposase